MAPAAVPYGLHAAAIAMKLLAPSWQGSSSTTRAIWLITALMLDRRFMALELIYPFWVGSPSWAKTAPGRIATTATTVAAYNPARELALRRVVAYVAPTDNFIIRVYLGDSAIDPWVSAPQIAHNFLLTAWFARNRCSRSFVGLTTTPFLGLPACSCSGMARHLW